MAKDELDLPSNRKKILVTGANGQLGNEFRDLAGNFPDFDFLFASRADLPIEDEDMVMAYLVFHQPDFCINCAAYTAVDNAEKESALASKINGYAVGRLAFLCKEMNIRFVHISTDYVFDGSGKRPYREDDPVEPVNTYGATKLLGEELGMKENPEAIIIRSSWIYSSHGKNFVKTMIRLMGERKEISVVSDQRGCPTYAADLAGAIMQIIDISKWNAGIYHFANAGEISWYEFAMAIRDLIGSSCIVNPIPSSAYPVPAERPAYSVFDLSKIQETFSIKLRDWRESLKRCLDKINI